VVIEKKAEVAAAGSLKNFWWCDDNLSSTVILWAWQDKKKSWWPREGMEKLWVFSTLPRNYYFLAAWRIAFASAEIKPERVDW